MQNKKAESFLTLKDPLRKLNVLAQDLKDLNLEVEIENRQLIVKNRFEPNNISSIQREFIQNQLSIGYQLRTEEAQEVLERFVEFVNYKDDFGKGVDIEVNFIINDHFVPIDLEIENSKIISNLIFKYGLNAVQQSLDFKLQDLKFEANIATECSMNGIENGIYNPNIMLERETVGAITKTLLKGQNYELYQLNLEAEWERQQKEENMQAALIATKQGKPVALQLSNNHHWITVCLLPDKTNPNQINLVGMNGMGDSTEYVNNYNLAERLQALGTKIGVEVSDLYDLSVEGQQYGNSCGMDTALNTAAIIQTYNQYDIEFYSKFFKDTIDQNIYYQKKENGKYYLHNNQPTNASHLDILKTIGTNLILSSAEAIALQSAGLQSPQKDLENSMNDIAKYTPENRNFLNKFLTKEKSNQVKQPIQVS